MFHPIPTVFTFCKHEVSVFDGRIVLDGHEVASGGVLAEGLRASGDCPDPDGCAADALWKLEQLQEPAGA